MQKTAPLATRRALRRAHLIMCSIADEWKLAANERRQPNIDNITGKSIDEQCAIRAIKSPHWPTILYSTDLSKYVVEHPPESRWWLPIPSVGNGVGG